eukprot:3496026-Rhodomonas_salina.1
METTLDHTVERYNNGFRLPFFDRESLLQTCEQNPLVKEAEADLSEDALVADCSRISHLETLLKWHGLTGLVCVTSLGTALALVDLPKSPTGSEGAEKLAGVLAMGTLLAHLEVDDSQIRNEGEGVLAGCWRSASCEKRGRTAQCC